MKDILNLSTSKLKQIIDIKAQIERLQAKLHSLVDNTTSAANSGSKMVHHRRPMSEAAKRKISLAQKARWAKQKSAK